LDNVVEGMTYGANTLDMTAKPKDNTYAADNLMQNQSNPKSQTKQSELARNINAVPLYIDPDYQHNTTCL
jgi:hypothetical protein